MNPYESPQADCSLEQARSAPTRAALAATIRAFLDEQITAFEFDEALEAFYSSGDPVIDHVVHAAWYHYDDIEDHLVCMTKQEWDYFQRLLLLLEADCELEKRTQRHWSPRQVVAATSLVAFGYLASHLGWSGQLYLLAAPFGLVSIALSRWPRPAVQDNHHPYHEVIFPFATFSDLATAYRATQFAKTRYPRELADRMIRLPIENRLQQLHSYLLWLMFAPVPLFVQMFPESETRTMARMAQR